MKQPETTGVCENCKHEFEEEGTPPPASNLYRIGKQLMCGDCANQYAGDMDFMLSAYGRIDGSSED